MAETIEVRCPVGPQRLFLKLSQSGTAPTFTAGNLLEIACDDCKRLLRRRFPNRRIDRVIHHFGFDGKCVESVVEPR